MASSSAMPGASSIRRRGKAEPASSAVVASDIGVSPGNARQCADHDRENERGRGDHGPSIE
jgi:hypothetical protein